MKRSILTVAAMLFISTAWTQGAVPRRINFQGRLSQSDGTPVSGLLTMTFELYEQATSVTPVWSEIQDVACSEGLFSVELGASTPIGPSVVESTSALWLEVSVGGESLLPRYHIASAAFALLAETAGTLTGTTGMGDGSNLDADLLDGIDSTGFADASHDHDTRYYTEAEVNTLLADKADATSTALFKEASWSESLSITDTTRQYFTADHLQVTPPDDGYLLVIASGRYNVRAQDESQGYAGIYVSTDPTVPGSGTGFTEYKPMGFAFPMESGDTDYGDFPPTLLIETVQVTGGQTYHIWLGFQGVNITGSNSLGSPSLKAVFLKGGM